MSDITPERIAEHLHGRDLFINRAFAGFVDVAADGAVAKICFTPNRHLKHVYGTRHFRAVVVPGETVPDLAEVDRLKARLEAAEAIMRQCLAAVEHAEVAHLLGLYFDAAARAEQDGAA